MHAAEGRVAPRAASPQNERRGCGQVLRSIRAGKGEAQVRESEDSEHPALLPGLPREPSGLSCLCLREERGGGREEKGGEKGEEEEEEE